MKKNLFEKQLFKTLKFRLIMLLLLFAIIPMFVMNYVLLTSISRESVKSERDNVHSQLTLVHDHLESVFDDIIYNVDYFSSNNLMQSVDDSITSYVGTSSSTNMTPLANGPMEQNIFRALSNFGKTHPEYRYISYGTEYGGYIQYPDDSIGAGYDPRVRTWYEAAKANPDRAIIGEPYYFEEDQITLVSVSKAVKGPTGNILGVVLIDVSLDSLSQIFAQASETSKGTYLFVTGDGTIVADPSSKDNQYKNISEVYGAETLEAIHKNADFESVKINGTSYYVTNITSERTGWNCVSLNEASVVKAMAKQLGIIAAGAILFVLILVLPSGYRVGRNLANPILYLANTGQEIAGGDFDVQIDIESEGEIGTLIAAFRQIGLTLQEYKTYIAEISSVLDQVAEGDMTFELQSEYRGEFSSIKTALLNISETLTDALGQIKVSSDHISSGADQVSSVAQSLSQGATEQASSIEELSAAIAQVTNQINDNARNAQDARDKTISAGHGVMNSSKQMENLNGAMDVITSKADEISKIIKIIDDIAFQTNILALNAAVEAARAGEAGRGFAVVADEVRNLAARSADAARDTAQLIQETIQAVHTGSNMARDTTQLLEQSSAEASIVVDLISSIANASQEQAISVSQIDQGVDQISSVVQTTAATAEESAATSEELSAQASTLNDAVARFRLRDDLGMTSFEASYMNSSTSYQPKNLNPAKDSDSDSTGPDHSSPRFESSYASPAMDDKY